MFRKMPFSYSCKMGMMLHQTPIIVLNISGIILVSEP